MTVTFGDLAVFYYNIHLDVEEYKNNSDYFNNENRSFERILSKKELQSRHLPGYVAVVNTEDLCLWDEDIDYLLLDTINDKQMLVCGLPYWSKSYIIETEPNVPLLKDVKTMLVTKDLKETLQEEIRTIKFLPPKIYKGRLFDSGGSEFKKSQTIFDSMRQFPL